MAPAQNGDQERADSVIRIIAVRSEYTSARLIWANLEHRVTDRRYERAPGYLPPEVDYRTEPESMVTIQVRDYDVRFLERVKADAARIHLERIHQARRGNEAARSELAALARKLHPEIARRFLKSGLIENDLVVPYTTEKDYPATEISDKGLVLLKLSRLGFATPDFNFLTAGVYELPAEGRRVCLRAAIHNLQKLSGRRLGDPNNPLLIAMRSAMPDYLPGFMPTYLNVGLTPTLLPGLPRRYGDAAVARMRLSNRRTILEALDPAAYAAIEGEINPGLTQAENNALTERIEALITAHDPRLLDDAHHQLEFFLEQVYAYYDLHFDTLRNFMGNETRYPTVILQRMVCSVLDQDSYAGVLYSRHPRLGTGVHLQYARTIYGEDLMTGRLTPEEVHLQYPEEARVAFPAVHHFWQRLPQLERIFAAPVMVEFTGVHGTFTILQVNQAELSGVGMLTAVMNLYHANAIDAARVRELIQPFHIRQIESDTIDIQSLKSLTPFCQGVSVLPRSAVTGRLYFSAERIAEVSAAGDGDKVILVKSRFTPTDTMAMQQVDGICSLSPAAIHVVTTAQTLGVPTLLSLEEHGVRLDDDGRGLLGADGLRLREGDWVTISSRNQTLYVGKAVYATARLLRFMDGDEVPMSPRERTSFERLAGYYREYRRLLEGVEADGFKSLQDLGHAVRSGTLRSDPEQAADVVNRSFDANKEELVARLLDTTLGMHLSNQTAYRLLTIERRAQALEALVDLARARGRRGYEAGSFVIGCLVDPDAPGDLWQRLNPATIAGLLDEWVLHRKYQELLSEVGERKLNRTKDVILTRGLGDLYLHPGLVKPFMPLKLSGVDLGAVARALPPSADAQTGAVIELLRRPYGEFYDYTRRDSLAQLDRLCETECRPRPEPDAC